MIGGRTTANSPFDAEDIDQLVDMSMNKNPIRTIYINKYFPLDLYEEIDILTPLIIGVDVSSGIGKDASSIVLVNSKTKHIIGIMNNSRIDTDDLADVIYTLVTTIAINSTICIERNNVGSTVINKLRKMPEVEPRLYRELQTDELKQKMKDGFIEEQDITAAHYGIWTDDVKRQQMFELLGKFVKNYKERICPVGFIDQLKCLEYNKKGRVDHAKDKHDDIIMAYNMAMWTYYYGNNISSFGIIRYPDPQPGMTTEEDIRKQYLDEVNTVKDSAVLGAIYEDSSIPQIKTMQDLEREEQLQLLAFQSQGEQPINANGDGVIKSNTNAHVTINPYDQMNSIYEDLYGTSGDIDFSNFI